MEMEVPSNWLRKGAWTAEEDILLRQCIDKYGEGKWHLVPLRSGLNRCRKSCRLRWLNYLKPTIKRGRLSSDEVDLVIRLHRLLGNRWSLIAGRIPGRTANDIKNYWNTHLSKKQDLSCKTNMGGSVATLAPKINVTKPQPRSFSNNQPEVDLGGITNMDDSITCSKDEEKNELAENAMDGESMWWESFMEENGAAGTSMMNSSSSMLDFEKSWSMLNEETWELE